MLLKVNFDFSCFWADVPFRGFVLNDAQTRRPIAQVSAAHTASTYLRSSRSLHLSLRSTAQSFEQVTWRPVKHRFIESCLIFGICEQGLAQTQFFAVTDSHQSETDIIYLASFGNRSFEEHLK